ncbi:MAG TPA: glycerol kinase GlpK [Bacteroidales bacterium]|nr:glycerol kinase GlpK [Bacteroidales bacterium]
MERYILALDQGTTSSRALLFDHSANIRAKAQQEFSQLFPEPGQVEHDPAAIWSSQMAVVAEVMAKAGISGKELAGIGITNQRETVLVWDRRTGLPVYNAIVWQDRRTSAYCDKLKVQGYEPMIEQKTGLVIDAYFSATKVKWILDHVVGVRSRADNGELAFGTVDSWLVWKLTGGQRHSTDASNASRTMLYNINEGCWDKELLELFDIPASMLPGVNASSAIIGETSVSHFGCHVPISGIAGDQQSALFGQLCLEEGMVKSTYGTGCFILKNTGSKPFHSKNKLVTSIGWQMGKDTVYALEGSIFNAGAVVQWLRDGLNMIRSSSEVEALASGVSDNGDIYFVPAFTGLGAPHWDQYARGIIAGIDRGTKAGHIARAALEGIAYQVMDVIRAMEKDTGMEVTGLRVDGGAAANNLLMQFQSDILGIPVFRPASIETTALGAAYLAGLSTGFWTSMDELTAHRKDDTIFQPAMSRDEARRLISKWHDAVRRSKSWNK